MLPFSVFHDHLRPFVVGCPLATINDAILHSAIEFCKESGVWVQMNDPAPYVNGNQDYEVDVPNDARLGVILNIYTTSGELTPKRVDELPALLPDWQTAEGTPVFYNMPDWDTLRVYPIPVNEPSTSTFTVRATFVPRRNARMLPDVLADRYFDAIVAGAREHLFSMPRQTWTDSDQALFNKAEFERAQDKVKVEALHERTRGSATVKPRRFGY